MADCGDPLCCRKESGVALLESQKAGRYRLELATDTALKLLSWSLPRMLKSPIHRWGDFRKCDTPLRTIEAHPAFKREDRLGKEPFAGFGTVVEDITGSGYTKNQPILLGPF